MFLFLINKRRISIFDSEGVFAKRIRDFRRFDHRSANYLVMFVLSLFLLLIAVRVGSLLWFMLTNYGEVELAQALQGINLPSLIGQDKVENKRLISYVSVDKDGNFFVAGNKIDPSDLEIHFYNKYRELPNIIITIVADKECKMGNLYILMRAIRKGQCHRVHFLTDKHGIKKQ